MMINKYTIGQKVIFTDLFGTKYDATILEMGDYAYSDEEGTFLIYTIRIDKADGSDKLFDVGVEITAEERELSEIEG